MRRTAVLGLAAALGLGFGMASAEAECAMPHPAMPPDGTVLPPNPVLWRFEPSYRAPTSLRIAGADGRPLEYTGSYVSVSNTVRAYEYRIDVTSGSFTVHGEEDEPPHTYTIGGFTKPTAPPVVESVTWVDDAWTCSHSLGLVIEARGAGVVAFRASWPSSGYRDWVIPANDRHFWSREMGGEIDPSALRAFLGHPSCVENLIGTELIGRRDVRLFAIYADGSELEVELPRAGAAQSQPQAQAQAQPQPQPPPVYVRRPGTALAPWKIALATAVSIAALISVSTLLVARRRRRNAMIVP